MTNNALQFDPSNIVMIDWWEGGRKTGTDLLTGWLLTDWPTDGWIEGRTEWITVYRKERWTNWLLDWLPYKLTNGRMKELTDWLTDWHSGDAVVSPCQNFDPEWLGWLSASLSLPVINRCQLILCRHESIAQDIESHSTWVNKGH